jgi:hypothetical protein
MIPKLRSNGTLKPGQHNATWAEVVSVFGKTPWRQRLLPGLEKLCRHLRDAGATKVWLDGSFTTSDPLPGDYDLCYSAKDVDQAKLDPCIVNRRRDEMKDAYFGEAYADDRPSAFPGAKTVLDLFQLIKYTTTPKGIVVLDLGTLP